MIAKANFLKALLVSPVALSAALVTMPQATYAQASGPVTAISELSDVQPTDWAFQALQSLVERYGCIAGYPDRTYRGNRAMTRFEFAAGMNACLDRINELIASGLADKVSKEDLATVQKLQEEFQAELTALKGRVDKIEGDVKTLQSQVFNPVTKLNVEVVTALVGQGLSDDIVGPSGLFTDPVNGGVFVGNGGALQKRDSANMTLNYRVRMNFDASFTGKDKLRIRLQARDFNTSTVFGSNDPGFGVGGGGGTTFRLGKLFYTFPIFNDSVQVIAVVTGGGPFEILKYALPTDALSDFADAPNTTYDGPGNTLLGFSWKASDLLAFTYAYGADDAQNPGPGSTGLFGSTSAHYAELAFTPSDTLGLYLAYSNIYDAGARNNLNNYSVATNWEITPRVIFTGWYASTSIDNGGGDANGYLVGFAFPDLFSEGAQGGITFGQPIVSTATTTRPTVLDVYYSFPVSKYITLTPGFYLVSNPLGGVGTTAFEYAPGLFAPNANDPSIIVGALRATFKF